EDGIRDFHVTGVQTCALPIYPLIIGSVLGVVCAAFGWLPPDIVMAPLDLVAAAAVPILLLNFGLSLAGDRVLAPGPYRKDVILEIGRASCRGKVVISEFFVLF